jgi:hypothetical protein
MITGLGSSLYIYGDGSGWKVERAKYPEEYLPHLYFRVFIRVTCAFLVVICEAGDVFANFVLAYFGITFLMRHCLLK